MLKTHNAYDLAALIGKASGILKELYNDKTVEGLARYENIQELLNGIKEFTESRLPAVTPDGEVKEEQFDDKSLSTYLQEITLLTDADKDKGDNDRIKLMTIHSAKGLEFSCVYVVGMEENLFPSMMSLNSREDLEEERRLFYVAITRAKTKLAISYAINRYRYGTLVSNDPSRFLEEIDKRNLEFTFTQSQPFRNPYQEDRFTPVFTKPNTKPNITPTPAVHKPSPDFVADDFREIQVGMEVEHQRFGFGKVLHLEGTLTDRMATIHFQNNIGQKKIMLKYAKLRILKRNTFSEN